MKTKLPSLITNFFEEEEENSDKKNSKPENLLNFFKYQEPHHRIPLKLGSEMVLVTSFCFGVHLKKSFLKKSFN